MDLGDVAPDEVALAGAEHLDHRYVATYDEKAGFDPTDEIALLQSLGVQPDSTVVDLGAGTGAFALATARFCRRVVAVDPSAAMLDAVRQKAADSGVAVECVKAGFLSYQHRGDPADLVYSRNALHHLPDFWKAVALQRISALLRPSGILRLRDLVFSFPLAEASDALRAWLDAAPDNPRCGWTAADLRTHLQKEFSTFSWLLEPMLERAGFAITDASYPSAVHASYVCTKEHLT